LQMKKTLIALAALGAMAGVHAQSTVTLYGLVDANLQSQKNNFAVSGALPAGVTAATATAAQITAQNTAAGGATIQSARQSKIDSGGLNGSRWGLRISEDLGGGMAAVANLESGINLDNGSSAQGGLLFGRRANVGVSSSSFGTVVIGRNSSSYDDVSADHTMMAQTIFDPSNNNNAPATFVNAGTNVSNFGTATGAAAILNRPSTWIGFNTRFNNSVKYSTPNFSGFSASVMYAFGEDKTAAVGASQTVSANLKYANGPLLVSGGYQSEANPRTAAGAKPALENALLSVAYDFGVAKVGAGFNRAKFKDVVLPGFPGTTSLGSGAIDPQKEVSLSVAVPLGATTLSASVARSKGDTLGKSTGYGIQALYSLSKRSTLYAGAQSTKGYDKLIASFPGSNANKITTYGLGLRHTF
jgi:predicted porin